MTHIAFERLSDLAESEMTGRAGALDEERRHLGSCAECRDTLAEVRTLLAAARALPTDIAPPPEVWTRLRARVGVGAAPRSVPGRSWGRWVAAAATVVFVAGAALLLPGRMGRVGKAKAVADSPAPEVGRVERHYAETLAELRATLDAQRPKYAPAAVGVVDRTLAVIDTAIAETREALAADPQNPVLVERLSSHYERKVELLQRASELAPSS